MIVCLLPWGGFHLIDGDVFGPAAFVGIPAATIIAATIGAFWPTPAASSTDASAQRRIL
jgi:hypothetical protein